MNFEIARQREKSQHPKAREAGNSMGYAPPSPSFSLLAFPVAPPRHCPSIEGRVKENKLVTCKTSLYCGCHFGR